MDYLRRGHFAQGKVGAVHGPGPRPDNAGDLALAADALHVRRERADSRLFDLLRRGGPPVRVDSRRRIILVQVEEKLTLLDIRGLLALDDEDHRIADVSSVVRYPLEVAQ